MDELLAAMYKVAVQLVPILGVAVLCFLIALIRHCIALIKELTETAKKAGTTLEGVDKSIDKLQAPLDTAVRVSETVDQIQQTAVETVKNVAGFVAGNLDSGKEAFASRASRQSAPEAPVKEETAQGQEKAESENTAEGETDNE